MASRSLFLSHACLSILFLGKMMLISSSYSIKGNPCDERYKNHIRKSHAGGVSTLDKCFTIWAKCGILAWQDAGRITIAPAQTYRRYPLGTVEKATLRSDYRPDNHRWCPPLHQ